MPLSYVEYAVATTGNTYTIDFKFLDSSHVKLSVTSGGALVDHSNFTINIDGTIMTVGGSYAMPIKIYRQTPGTTSATKDDQVIDFQDGSVVSEADLDRATLQALYASQESRDYVDDSVTASTGTGELPTTTNENYILSSGTGVTPTPTWISSATLQPLLPAAVADTANTIPIRSSDATPTITSTFVGNITGDLTGNADTSTALETSRTFKSSGDVTIAAPIAFTGIANVNMVLTVDRIQGNDILAGTPTDGYALTYDEGNTRWAASARNTPIAIFATEATGIGYGKSLTIDTWMSVPIDTVVDNASLSSVTLVTDTTDGVLKFADAGTYRIEWHIPFYDGHSCYTKLMKSAEATLISELLSEDPNLAGKATVAMNNYNSQTGASSHGFARLVLAGGPRYIQLQAFANRGTGTLGRSTADPTDAFYYALVTITKEF